MEADTTHNSIAEWIKKYENTAHIERMSWDEISIQEIEAALNTSGNWKTSGHDGIPNLWLKRLVATHVT